MKSIYNRPLGYSRDYKRPKHLTFKESDLMKDASNYTHEIDLKSPSFFNNKDLIRRSIH